MVCALDFCHSHNVYHRDLKQEKLLLNEHINLKFLDFGRSDLPEQLRWHAGDRGAGGVLMDAGGRCAGGVEMERPLPVHVYSVEQRCKEASPPEHDEVWGGSECPLESRNESCLDWKQSPHRTAHCPAAACARKTPSPNSIMPVEGESQLLRMLLGRDVWVGNAHDGYAFRSEMVQVDEMLPSHHSDADDPVLFSRHWNTMI
nr:CBL-interacting serine/threonine-protein kinase 25-like [Ipomoea batatas]